jgi:non-specific serine/threonine protein kinase
LAIELAAPRLRSMSVEELSQRLDHRFAVLTDGSRTALPRHRTLRSMLDWSYDLLTKAEQAMLRRVSVFAGGWTLASAEQVCAGEGIERMDVLDLLTSLADKSLVATDEQSGATRYRILETVRQYALDRLRDGGEEARWRGLHLACFVAFSEEFIVGIDGPDQQSWVVRFAREHDNLRAALAWAVEASPIEGVRLAIGSFSLWRVRGPLEEGRAWLARLLGVFPSDGPKNVRARALRCAAMYALLAGDHACVKGLVQESLTLSREVEDSRGVSRSLELLFHLEFAQGHYPEAEALVREILDIACSMGDRKLTCRSLGDLADVLHRQGQRGAAREMYERALDVARELGTPFEMGNALREVGSAELDEGRHDLALKHLAEGVTILHGLGDRLSVIESLEGLAGVAAATAAPRRAVQLWGAVDALRREIGSARSVHDSTAYERQVKAVRTMLTAAAFDQAWDEGRAMTLDGAVHYALDEQAGRDR